MDDTFGYLALEYVVIGRVTIKVDVGKFGVVLMEPITGHKVVDLDVPLFQVLKQWKTIEGGVSSLRDEDYSLKSLDNAQASIPNKPLGFAYYLQSVDCR